MKQGNMNLPTEGQVVIVTAKIKQDLIERIQNPIGTCLVVSDSIVAVIFPSGDMWWGKPREVFIYEGDK
jgi:hypothetical protein